MISTSIAGPPHDRNHYRSLLFSEIPPDFFRRWIEEANRAYAAAFAYVHGAYQRPEAHDLLGHDRRARVEDVMLRVAEEFKIDSPSEKNKTRNYYHREVRAGRLVLTQSYSDDSRVRQALHRNELADRMWAGDLFRGGGPVLKAASSRVYAMIVHGAHPEARSQLGYVKACFPDADCDRYITEVDLLREFPIRARTPEEQVAESTAMTPRRQSKEDQA